MLPEVRMARVLDAISSHRAGRLSCVEAGELLGFSERHFPRLRDAFEARGEDGLIDRRRGRVNERNKLIYRTSRKTELPEFPATPKIPQITQSVTFPHNPLRSLNVPSDAVSTATDYATVLAQQTEFMGFRSGPVRICHPAAQIRLLARIARK